MNFNFVVGYNYLIVNKDYYNSFRAVIILRKIHTEGETPRDYSTIYYY